MQIRTQSTLTSQCIAEERERLRFLDVGALQALVAESDAMIARALAAAGAPQHLAVLPAATVEAVAKPPETLGEMVEPLGCQPKEKDGQAE